MPTQAPHPLSDIDVLIPVHDIHARVKGIAQDIAADFKDDVMIIPLLRGSFVFAADLLRALHYEGLQPQLDFMTLASYGRGTSSSGEVQLVKDIVESVEGRDVLIVDDILESGRTLTFARDLIKSRGARSVKIAVLLEKPGKRKVAIDADYIGFVVQDKFVVGYGLDYANFYRELPFIGVLMNR